MNQILLTAPTSHVAVPPWIRDFAPQTATGDQLRDFVTLPELTVVRLRSLGQAETHSDYFRCLAALFSNTSQPARILLAFDKRAKIESPTKLAGVFQHFDHPAYLEVARHDASLAILEALAKNQAARARKVDLPPTTPPADPLARVESVIAATADLRAASGRLSAGRVAETFGLRASEIAKLAGVTRQAVSKTDDSPRLQAVLRPLERIARLRTRLQPEDFRHWLHLPSSELVGETPLGAIQQGRAEAIADWVENLLLGNPT